MRCCPGSSLARGMRGAKYYLDMLRLDGPSVGALSHWACG